MRASRIAGAALGLALALAGASSAHAQAVDVAGNAKWVDTGVKVGRGVALRLRATGRVNFGSTDGSFGPEGTEYFLDRSGYLAATDRRLGLVARITASADSNDPLRVDLAYGHGDNQIAIPMNAAFNEGRLWLGVNDYRPADNSGEYVVRISTRLSESTAGTAGGQGKLANSSTAADGRRRGVYRITVNGFTCNTETWDHAFEVDGKRDEVLFLSSVTMVSSSGNLLLSSAPMSRVMGDTNHREWMWPSLGYRVRAGSASRLGGVRTGDRFPSATPWRRTVGVNADRPAQLVFEGELVEGMNGVVVAPTIWEWDGSPMFMQGWLTAIEDNGPVIAGAVMNIVTQGSGAGDYVKKAAEVGLPALANLIRGVLGNAGDRMIGLSEKTEKGQYTGNATAITLNYELAELARSTNFGKGLGVLELQYRDHRDIGGGWYTLYLQVERIE